MTFAQTVAVEAYTNNYSISQYTYICVLMTEKRSNRILLAQYLGRKSFSTLSQKFLIQFIKRYTFISIRLFEVISKAQISELCSRGPGASLARSLFIKHNQLLSTSSSKYEISFTNLLLLTLLWKKSDGR